jgi:hypothetical protein
MSWQLWVVIALAATGVLLLAVARMRHARDVFDDITRLDRPAENSQLSADELTRARVRRADPGVRRDEQSDPRRKHG